MKTNFLMKLTITILLFGLTTAWAGEAQITAQSVAQDAVAEYKAALDQVIRNAAEAKGKFTPAADEAASLRSLEYELLGHARLGALKRAELPALVFAEGKPQTVEEIPGRALELRLLRLRVNPWEDGLTNKAFQYYPEAGYGETDSFSRPCPTNRYPELGNFQASYAYAMALIARREWADASKQLTDATAVPGGTAGGEWEFQILITRAWAEAMAGDFAKAKATLEEALARDRQCEMPVRGRFLSRLLGIEGQHLMPEVAAALPNEK
jgi:hypothetical protein